MNPPPNASAGPERRFPLLVGLGAFRALTFVPAWLLVVVSASQLLYFEGYDLPFGAVIGGIGYVGLLLFSFVIVASPLGLFSTARRVFEAVREAVGLRACDVWLSPEGLRIKGGKAHGFRATWNELARDRGLSLDDKGLSMRQANGRHVHVMAPRDPEERASIEALVATARAYAAAANLEPRTAPRREPPDLLRCPACGAPQTPAEASTIACGACGANVPVPPALGAKVRALRETASARLADDRLTSALVTQRGARAANVIVFLGGLLVLAATLFTIGIGAAACLVDGFEFGLPRWGGLWALELGLCFGFVATVRWLLADRRALRMLTLGFAALAPERPGAPPACRACGGPLPEPEGAAATVYCAYCSSPNVLTADLRIEADALRGLGETPGDPHELLAVHATRRRSLARLGTFGALLGALGLLWLAFDRRPPGDTRGAVAVPFTGVPIRTPAAGPLQAGPGANALERVATFNAEIAALLPDGQGGVDVVTVGDGTRLVRAPHGQIAREAGEPLSTEQVRLWARAPDGVGLLFSDGHKAHYRAPNGTSRLLYGERWFDDRLIGDLAVGPGGSTLLATRVAKKSHWRLRTIGPGASSKTLRDARAVALHPDGRTLAAQQIVGEGSYQITLVPPEGRAHVLTRGEGHAILPAWSHDGQRLAFMTGTVRDSTDFGKRYGETHLWIINDAGSGAPSGVTRLTQGPSLEELRPVWTNRGIYVSTREAGRSVLWRVSPR